MRLVCKRAASIRACYRQASSINPGTEENKPKSSQVQDVPSTGMRHQIVTFTYIFMFVFFSEKV